MVRIIIMMKEGSELRKKMLNFVIKQYFCSYLKKFVAIFEVIILLSVTEVVV